MSTTLLSDVNNLTREQRTAFIEGAADEMLVDLLDGWVEIDSTDAAKVEDTSGNAATVWAVKDYTGDIVTNKMTQGYTEIANHVTYAQATRWDEASWLTLDKKALNDYFKSFGTGGTQALVQLVTDLFNNGTTTARGDGKALFVSDHPSNVGDQSNIISNTLGHEGMQLAQQQAFDLQGPDGQAMMAMLDRIMVPTALGPTAKSVVSAGVLVPTAGSFAYATPNPTAGAAAVTVNPLLTSATRWFPMATNRGKVKVLVLRGMSPEIVKMPGGYDRVMKDQFIALVYTPSWRWTIGGNIS